MHTTRQIKVVGKLLYLGRIRKKNNPINITNINKDYLPSHSESQITIVI
jgi:hypothetical protein